MDLRSRLLCGAWGWLLAAGTLGGAWPAAAQGPRGGVAVSGRLTILEKNKKPAKDLGDAVIWLEGAGSAGRAGALEVAIDDKLYVPRVLVVPVGATVRFPNHDPFRHNVFSVSEPNQFDLGLYGR
ncbi:MAG: hypothetical protein ACREMV_10870, partial [Gemmatimonadales bacterium]